MPADLAEQGVVFTDFHTALEADSRAGRELFMSGGGMNDIIGCQHTVLFQTVQPLVYPQCWGWPADWRNFYQDSESDVPFNKYILIIAGKTFYG